MPLVMISDVRGRHRRMPTALTGRFKRAPGTAGGQIEYYPWPVQATLRREQGAFRARVRKASTQPLNEWKSPSGVGNMGTNGTNGKLFVVSNPAFDAAPWSTNGSNAFTAC